MELYSNTLDYILGLPSLGSWTDARVLVTRAIQMKPRDLRLPVLTCEAVGGRAQQAIPASASLACAWIAIRFIDDMLDDDPYGEFRRLGEAQTANYASAFLGLASQAILSSRAADSAQLAALQHLNSMIVTLSYGQYLDLGQIGDEAEYWRLVHTKSASFFAAALQLGAIFGGASEDTAAALGELGDLYGEMIQIHDDLNDAMAAPADPDWIQGRRSLPILFGESVSHPERARFLELLQDILAPGALQEAQGILIRSGAVSYCMDQLLQKYQAATRVLDAVKLKQREGVDTILDELIAPVRKVLAATGKTLPRTFQTPGLGNGE